MLDDPRPNVFYEIGVAHALGKPVVLLNTARGIGDGAPFDIGHYQRTEFAHPTVEVAKRLQDTIIALRDPVFR